MLNVPVTNKQVVELRPEKGTTDPMRPNFFLNEKELQEDGNLKSVNTIFLTNRECPFKCVMCDLWKHTLNRSTPAGAVPAQIRYAAEKLPDAEVVKLYNSGNFFDGKAIPRADYEEIAELIRDYDHVIIENHPKLIGPFISEFQNLLNGSLEVAMGLETIHPEVLPKLNKQITVKDFRRAVNFLITKGISVRAFILLNPPYLTDVNENIEWCLRSIDFAFDTGVSACSVIPTRDGNGIMQKLRETGDYVPPKLSSLESVVNESMKQDRGRVFCDLWDLEMFSNCDKCFLKRKDRLQKMNLSQKVLPEVVCTCSA